MRIPLWYKEYFEENFIYNLELKWIEMLDEFWMDNADYDCFDFFNLKYKLGFDYIEKEAQCYIYKHMFYYRELKGISKMILDDLRKKYL